MNELLTTLLKIKGRPSKIRKLQEILKDKSKISKLFILQRAIDSHVDDSRTHNNIAILVLISTLKTYLTGLMDG